MWYWIDESWPVFIGFAVGLNVWGFILSFRVYRKYLVINDALMDCVGKSWSMKHTPTYVAWSQTLGMDLEIDVSVRPIGTASRGVTIEL